MRFFALPQNHFSLYGEMFTRILGESWWKLATGLRDRCWLICVMSKR